MQSHVQCRTSSTAPMVLAPPPPQISTSQIPRSAVDLRKYSMPTNMPSIAVTPSTLEEEDTAEDNEEKPLKFTRPTIKMSPQRHIDVRRRKSADPIEPIYSNM